MQLEHSFTVPVGIDDAWRVLLDIELVAPCMPGAALDSVDGDDFTGTVKVKLGPIGLTYKGKASFVEKDEVAHRAVIDARGRDSRGSGTANAKVTATLTESGSATKVDVLTDLDITGKPAQFGRGVMVDVGNKLIGQFADCLAGKLADGATRGAAVSAESPTSPMETAVPDQTPTTAKPRPSEAADEAVSAPAAEKATPAKAAKSAPAKSAPAKAAPAKASGAKAAPKTAAAKAPPAKAPAAASRAAATTASSATSASVPGPDEPTTLEPSPREPAAAEKVATVAALPTRPTAAPRRPADEVEPINLIESAGPALAKRLAPILALVILLIVIARRRRR